jgi:hypothetical protein
MNAGMRIGAVAISGAGRLAILTAAAAVLALTSAMLFVSFVGRCAMTAAVMMPVQMVKHRWESWS